MVKQADVAKALGVSIGTVDRALHGRPEVNQSTKERVLKMARRMGYQPNLAASVLRSKRRLRISVNLPREIASFFDQIREGIQSEYETLARATVELEFHTFPRLGVGELEAFDAAVAANVNGIIATVAHPSGMRTRIRQAMRSNIPLIAVATDVPGTDRKSVVSIDPAVSGALVGELMGKLLKRSGPIAVITGDVDTSDHGEKVRAFQESMREFWPEQTVLPPVEDHYDADEAYEKVSALLKDHPDLVGCYVSTVNSLPVIRALKTQKRLREIILITTDLFPQMIPYLRSGAITATIHQRPRTQGALALRVLYRLLSTGECPPNRVALAPHIVMRSNLDHFLKQYSESEKRRA